MNNLINQLEQYNIFLNLDNLNVVQILEKGKLLTTILDLDNNFNNPPLFFSLDKFTFVNNDITNLPLFYKLDGFIFVDFVNIMHDSYYIHLTTNIDYLNIIKKIMYEIIEKFKFKLSQMMSDVTDNLKTQAISDTTVILKKQILLNTIHIDKLFKEVGVCKNKKNKKKVSKLLELDKQCKKRISELYNLNIKK